MTTDYTARNPANWQIEDGMTVYGSDGEKLGTVRNYNPQAGYLDVQKGWFFHKDFYVPVSAVQSARGEGLTVRQIGGASAMTDESTTVETPTEAGIVLRLTKDALTDDRYAIPPMAGGTVDTEGHVATEEEGEQEVPTHAGDFYE